MCKQTHIPDPLFIFFLLVWALAGGCEEEVICDVLYPQPILEFKGIEEFSENGQEMIRYKLNTKNFLEYSDVLFEKSETSPCGDSRTSLEILDENNIELFQSCTLDSPVDLTRLSFSLPKEENAAREIFVRMTDHLCDKVYVSEKIPIFCLWAPVPELAFFGTEVDSNANEARVYTIYKLGLLNWQEYPDALFEKAPELASCGSNVSSGRTWVEILDEKGLHVYGYC